VPIIRCPSNGAAEMVARALADRLSKHIRGQGGGDALNERFAGAMNSSSHKRPVLFVEERTRDIATQLHHPCTYRALVHDLLGLRGNSVRVTTTDDEGGIARERELTYDLDSLQDDFWAENAEKPFPQVAVEVNKQLSDYRASKARVQLMQHSGGSVLDGDPAGGIESRTKDLTSLVETLPALQAQKRLLDKHTNIATALLSSINERSLDRFFQAEEALLLPTTGRDARPEHVQGALELLSESSAGSSLDKLRLLVLLCSRCEPSADQLSKCREAVIASGVDGSVVDGVLAHTRSLQRFSTGAPGSIGLGGANGGASDPDGNSSGGKLLSHTYSSLRDVFSASVNYFKPAAHKSLWLARTLEALILASDPLGVGRGISVEQRNIAERYLLLDPKLPPGSSVSSRTLTPIRKLITFMVGGGNYVEFENVQELAKVGPGWCWCCAPLLYRCSSQPLSPVMRFPLPAC
jgi:sec1 family domain-containing protein 1